MEHAQAFEPIQDGRICIEKLNGLFCSATKARLAEYSSGLKLAIERAWLKMHEPVTFITFHSGRRRAVRPEPPP